MAKAVTKTVYIVKYHARDYQFDTLAEAERFEAVNSIMDYGIDFLAHCDYLTLDFEDRDAVEKFFTKYGKEIIEACKVLTDQK